MNFNTNGKLEEYELGMQVVRADGRKEPPVIRYYGPSIRKKLYAKFTQLRGRWYNYLRKREAEKERLKRIADILDNIGK